MLGFVGRCQRKPTGQLVVHIAQQMQSVALCKALHKATLRWWTWTVRIRTVAKVPIQVNLLDSFREPIYQKIAKKSLQFHELGFSYCKIAKLLNVDEKTVAKAVNWITE